MLSPRFRLIVLLCPMVAAFGQEVGSKVCSGCHAEIYRKYSLSGMARSSGSLAAGPFRESFDNASFSATPEVDYRVSIAPGGYRLQFSRRDSTARGERLLRWFVGSGRVGRSYLFSQDGFLFQSPVAYYSLPAKWDVSPGYRREGAIHLTRAVETGCLRCHASRLAPVAGTQNGFRTPPFLEGGISCERCHGPGKSHVAQMTSGDHHGASRGPSGIVNPAKLDPARRDSVCAQCHLTGAARIARLRPKGEAYQPGELLSDYSAVFVWSEEGASAFTVNSHFEKLQQSSCIRASGNRLWCGSCHDPHAEPQPSQRRDYYRARCQKCHSSPDCKEVLATRLKVQDDCITCHMPKSPVRDVEHSVYTDHSIPRRVRQFPNPGSVERSLAPFWKTSVNERDLGLAYAAVAGANPGLRAKAAELLEKANTADPQDLQVVIQLAQLYDQAGNDLAASKLYEQALRLDPAQVPAAINLGVYWMQSGREQEAMRLWADALSRNPGLTGVSINLAVALYQSGNTAAARTTLAKALLLDPDSETAQKLLVEINHGHK